jgi:hypothetical protein
MAFGISGITAPAQAASANPLPELSLVNAKLATASAKPAAWPGDTIARSDETTNPDADREVIAELSGSPDAKASHTARTLATPPRPAPTPHLPATTHTQATSTLSAAPPLNGADPWGVAAGEAAAALGAVLGDLRR